MRWRDTFPEHEERRERERFAWLPLYGTDGFIYWLERVREVREYRHDRGSSGWCVVTRTATRGLGNAGEVSRPARPITPDPAASSPVGDQAVTPGEPNPDWRCPRTRGKPCEVASLRAVDTCFASCPTVTATFGVGDQETPR